MWWEHFSSESEAFSLWINEKEKELEAVSSISFLESSEKHINTVEVRSLHHSSSHSSSHSCFFPLSLNGQSCDQCTLYKLHNF